MHAEMTRPAAMTMPGELETAPAPLEARTAKPSLSLFGRTFLLLALLILGIVAVLLQLHYHIEVLPRTMESATHVASDVVITKTALSHSDPGQRSAVIKQLSTHEGMRIVPRLPSDTMRPVDNTDDMSALRGALIQRLGAPNPSLAQSLNGETGLWIAFDLPPAAPGLAATQVPSAYWLKVDPRLQSASSNLSWWVMVSLAAVLALAAAAIGARYVNRPFRKLSFATSRVRDGDFDASFLDEHETTREIREVNMGFNRMAAQLAKIEQDRAVMLAGISHDLRTPLARLRLETEISVADEDAKAHMASDIEQLDAIIDKFLDYARPEPAHLSVVSLLKVLKACGYDVRDHDDISVRQERQPDILVLADEVDLQRVFSNLYENARRYGRSADTGVALVDVNYKARDAWVTVRVRDHGAGVHPDILQELTKPFFRGDTARTAATGAGLGLAIVEKSIQRMGGSFSLSNTSSGGLAAQVRLQRAKAM